MIHPQKIQTRIAFCAISVTKTLLCASSLVYLAACSTTPTQVAEKKSPKEMAQLYTDLGTQALMRGEYSQAVEDLRKALALDANNKIAHNHLGLSLYGLGQKKQATQEIEQALKLDPSYSDAWINSGTISAEDGKLERAKESYRHALENLEFKNRHRALTNLAQVELRENNIDEARQLLYQSLQSNPEYCMSHFLLGSIFMQENNPLRAADELKKSIVSTCTSNVDGHYLLGMAYMKARKFDLARSQFMHLVENYPQTLQAQKAGDALKDLP